MQGEMEEEEARKSPNKVVEKGGNAQRETVEPYCKKEWKQEQEQAK